jgi:S1-C subfamily serine protease
MEAGAARMDLHAIDLLLLLLLVVAAVSGWRRGFAVVVLGYAGLLLGLALGAWAATRVGLFISAEDSLRRLLVGIVVFFLVAAICHSVATRLGTQLRSALTGRVAGGLDATGGTVAAVLMTAIAMWFVGLTLGSVPFSPVARAVSESAVLRTIDRVAPRPPAALAQLRGLLARSPFPDAFANLRPSTSGGAPPAAIATPGIRQAAASTVQIQSEGCGGLLFGSGFPVADQLVVTNAHVVAGTGRHRVLTRGGERLPATVVLFDPRRDLAFLDVPGLRVRPLAVLASARIGTTGAVVGYPGGGDEVVVGAKVVARTAAVGRDIYSSSLVRREIYVLRARVRKGDSGGPMVDRSGRSLGVVFAASTVDPNEGYALTGGELRTVLDQLGPRRTEVAVGQCAT